MTSDIVSKRIFIGGLGTDVSEKDIDDKFSRFGKISDLNLKQRKDIAGAVQKSFAHLNIECKEADLKKCFATFQNAKWKGSTLKLQYAKESFLNKLDKERIEAKSAVVEQAVKEAEEAVSLKLKQAPVAKIFVGPAVPGTQVPGKPDWIVGKYGRVLPVMKLKKSSHTTKTLRHDPSKLCHTAKVFKEKDIPLNSSCSSLSWEMEAADSEIVKKIKGEFKTTPRKKTKKPLSVTESVGNKQFILENITSSRHYLELKKTLPAEDQLEVVSVNREHKSPSIPKHQESNRFDSDSETDFNSFSEYKNKTKSKQRDSVLDNKLLLLAGVAPEKTYNNANNTTTMSTYNVLISKDKTKSNKRLKNCHSDLEKERLQKGKGVVEKPVKHSLDSVDVSSNNETDGSIDMASSDGNTENDSEDESISLKSTKKSPKNKRLGDQNFSRVPKFGGLSMLLSPKDSDLEVKASSVPSNSKKQKTLSKPDNLNDSDNSTEKTLDSQAGYDSASSAGTDEILQKHKAQQSQLTDLPSVSESSGKSYLKMLSKKRCSALDEKLLMLAGAAPEKTNNNTTNTAARPCYDSDDSELDSNDFELVAKRLAQKVADKKASNSSTRNRSTTETGRMLPKKSAVDPLEEVLKTLQSSATDTRGSEEPLQSKEKKKALTVNERRLQAVKEKMKMKQQQQNIMKNALDNIDSQKSNKRKVFSSDDEDGNDKITTETNKKAKIAQQVDKEQTKNDLKLFENSDDSDEDSDYADMFKSRPHLEGKKGERLMKLERKIGDSRFKLDAKFAESDSEGEPEEDVGAEPNELAAERDASLKLLEKVVGKSTLDNFTRKIKRNTKNIIDMNTVRFDPTKMSPAQPVKSKSESKELQTSSNHDEENIDALEKSETTKSNAEKSDTSKSNVVVSSSLVDLFRKEEKPEEAGGFSLLSQFDPPDPTDLNQKTTFHSNISMEEDITVDASDEDMYNTAEEDDTDEDDINTDDSEMENESKDKNLKIKAATVIKNKIDPLIKDSDSDDNSLAEESEAENEPEKTSEETDVKHNFSKELWNAGRVDIRYTKEKWLERWEEIRPVLVKIYKKKHKDAVKKRRIQSEQKRRKEFSKGSKRNSWFRKKRS